MVETLKHILGLCGEPHINIFHILSVPILSILTLKIKNYALYYYKKFIKTSYKKKY